MKKAEYVAQSVDAVNAAIARCREAYAKAQAELTQALATDASADELKARRDAVASAAKRIAENEALLPFFNSEALTDLCYAHRFDFAKLTSETGSNSRECKKRFTILMRAISLNGLSETAGKAEYAYLAALASGRLADSHTLAEAQAVMHHKTRTQAGYMRNFLLFFKAAKPSADGRIEFDRESATGRKLLGLMQ